MDRISVVTINFNGSEKTIKLLETLNSQSDINFQTIVVDNASDKYDVSRLEAWILNHSPDIFLLKNGINSGVPGGYNIGTDKALKSGASWVILLNNDVWVESDFMARLKANLREKKGVVGLPIDEGDDHIVYGGIIEWLKPTLRHIPSLVKNDLLYAIGGAMAVEESTFNDIGLFDENFFLYFEDADFSFRAFEAGIPIQYLSGPAVHHSPSSSTRKLGSSMLLRLHYRNALYFNHKHAPNRVRLIFRPWSWYILIKQVIKICLNIHREESLAIFKGVMDFYNQRYGKI